MYRKLSLLVVVLSVCVSASADVVVYNFPLDGSQAVPPVATPASGSAMVTLDTDTNELSWEISYQDLAGDLTAAHFHGPAAVGANAGVAVPITIGPSPILGSDTVSEEVEGWILDGLTYVNLHTTFEPAGEIRGQVVPEPAMLSLLGLGALTLLRRR